MGASDCVGSRRVSVRLGVLAAYLIAGHDIGQLPALTVLICIAAAVVFALLPLRTPRERLTALVIGTALFVLFGL